MLEYIFYFVRLLLLSLRLLKSRNNIINVIISLLTCLSSPNRSNIYFNTVFCCCCCLNPFLFSLKLLGLLDLYQYYYYYGYYIKNLISLIKLIGFYIYISSFLLMFVICRFIFRKMGIEIYCRLNELNRYISERRFFRFFSQ